MEQIVGSLFGVSYHTFDTLYDLLFTTERVIACIVQHPNDFRYRLTLKEFFIGHILAKRTEQFKRTEIAQERRHRLQAKPISELVTLHPSNFEIRYGEVTSVEITRGLFQPQLKLDTSKLPTTKQIIRFTIPKSQITEAQRLLKLVLASKVRET
jgi:hypothetical protein